MKPFSERISGLLTGKEVSGFSPEGSVYKGSLGKNYSSGGQTTSLFIDTEISKLVVKGAGRSSNDVFMGERVKDTMSSIYPVVSIIFCILY